MKIETQTRKKINATLYDICKDIRQRIPLGDIFTALRKAGVVAVQEDGREWEGMLCGQKGQARIDVAPVKTAVRKQDGLEFEPYDNTLLSLSWYKYEETGRYETIAYLS
jgi:hypothetical protein